ncbi:hypothetical protein QJV14_04190 [Listeria cossartiae subsp. cayugensis]|uniref:hypothetical protein n=1 Tax=Listeria TaxID=1637 RepID=UPI0028805C6B|nr:MULTISPECIES: hypothetical protein [Listeria]MDT0002494.1 hypothetical protein [Listeria cossartiae subsp. cayugensis]MDT0019138.1 hypothetical protein [Listeria cossartiae subsp. cayugensis]MDT0035289.1 hypothetical protein [Listeria cossartiae subsp. cayugensis]MDT0040888.1 hypothetical protein [Listeria cossartiae subsp. cayugensis]MDT0045991.1 hypothetical protein [Listeria cossartiae subsp. cayugensis]
MTTYYNRKFSMIEKKCITISDYAFEEEIILQCTQLSETQFPKQSERKKVVNDWIDFLTTHPKALKKIHCKSRMNQKLFDAICCQENLEELGIKWGMYPDITKIVNLRKLKYLSLTSGASLKDISPLGELDQLEVLILSTVGAEDYLPLKNLTKLKQLGLHSGMDNTLTANTLAFLSELKDLRNFHTTGFRLENGDYNPVLSLEKIEYLSVSMPDYDWKIWNPLFAKKFADIPLNMHYLL